MSRIEFHKRKLNREIAGIERDLIAFEHKYGMTSQDFYSRFERGLLEDSQDFVLWSGMFELVRANEHNLSKLS